MSIKHDHTLNPVTALEFYSPLDGRLLVFAGEGSYIKIFDTDESKLLSQCQIFHGQAIHGIVIRNVVEDGEGLSVVIWGGSSFAVLRKEHLEQLLSLNVSNLTSLADSVSDWILDVAISPYNDDGCVLVTAHNTVLQARLGGDGKAASVETMHSPSRSVLYSAHLIWESPSHIMVAAGTVFGEIIVWECSLSADSHFSGSRVLFVFEGHEGSIFGVNISPTIPDQDGKLIRLLASCSDDRTIRVWDLSEDSTISPQTLSDITSPRETGFGDNEKHKGSAKTRSRCLAVAMGHISRIWHVKFHIINSVYLKSPSVEVLSFGEDSTTRQWALDFATDSGRSELRGNTSFPVENGPSSTMDTNMSARLTLMATFATHSGKHIWSTAIRYVSDARSVLATGGADGKISFFEVPSSLSSDGFDFSITQSKDDTVTSMSTAGILKGCAQSTSWTLDDILSKLETNPPDSGPCLEASSLNSLQEDSFTTQPANNKPVTKPKVKKTPKDALNRYSFVSENELIVTTTFGRVLLGCLGKSIHWEELHLPELGMQDLRSYSITKGIPEIGVAFLSGTNGVIYVYRRGQMIREVIKVDGKVTEMFIVCNPERKSFGLLVITLAGRVANFLSSSLSFASPEEPLEEVTFKLPEKFIVTSAGYVNNLLIIGSRNGSLAIYGLKSEEPLKVWKDDTMRGDAISVIISILESDSTSSSSKGYFLAAGRNGIYSIFSITLIRDADMTVRGAELHPVHHGTPPFGPIIEGAWFDGPELFLYGFRSKSFVVWNETRQYEAANIECGGAHRSYAYSPLQNSNGGGYFVYTKASRLHLQFQRSASHQVIKQGGHGREIKACAVSSDACLIATGAEDTAIRIWRYEDGERPLKNRFECNAIVENHTAGVQHLQWHDSDYLFSSGGIEEFFIWAIEAIPGFGIGVICEARLPYKSEEEDLRIMSFDVIELPGSSELGGKRLLISLAYSDSTIRTYTYSKKERFNLFATGRYTSSCLTQIVHVEVSDLSICLLTAATDGILTTWSFPPSKHLDSKQRENLNDPELQIVILSSHRIHQSSIKSLDLTRPESGKYVVVATGGDDNAIGITIYPPTLNSPTTSAILRSAHAAAITGLCFATGSRHETGADELRIVTASNDQRIKEWRVRIKGEATPGGEGVRPVEIKKIGDAFTPVADVGDMGILRQGSEEEGDPKKAIVVGNGMEVWNFSSTHN